MVHSFAYMTQNLVDKMEKHFSKYQISIDGLNKNPNWKSNKKKKFENETKKKIQNAKRPLSFSFVFQEIK